MSRPKYNSLHRLFIFKVAAQERKKPKDLLSNTADAIAHSNYISMKLLLFCLCSQVRCPVARCRTVTATHQKGSIRKTFEERPKSKKTQLINCGWLIVGQLGFLWMWRSWPDKVHCWSRVPHVNRGVGNTLSDSIQCWNPAKKLFNSIFDSILLTQNSNSNYYSIQNKLQWFNWKDNSIQH